MNDQIIERIQLHLILLEQSLNLSSKILFFSQINDLNGVVNETENRERLMNIISKVQRSVEEDITTMDAKQVSTMDLGILKSWFNDLAIWSEKITALDKETVENLSQQKDEATKEIATIFRNKEMFKGYNHAAKK